MCQRGLTQKRLVFASYNGNSKVLERKVHIMETSLVQISKIDRSPNHRLKGDVSELMISLRHNGLLIPIKLKKKAKGRFEMVFGNRRLAAAKKLGWKKIDAILEGGRDFTKRRASLENVVENFNRVNPSIEDYTVAFERLRTLGMSTAEIAGSLGVSEVKIKMFRRMKEGLPKNITGSKVR